MANAASRATNASRVSSRVSVTLLRPCGRSSSTPAQLRQGERRRLPGMTARIGASQPGRSRGHLDRDVSGGQNLGVVRDGNAHADIIMQHVERRAIRRSCADVLTSHTAPVRCRAAIGPWSRSGGNASPGQAAQFADLDAVSYAVASWRPRPTTVTSAARSSGSKRAPPRTAPRPYRRPAPAAARTTPGHPVGREHTRRSAAIACSEAR